MLLLWFIDKLPNPADFRVLFALFKTYVDVIKTMVSDDLKCPKCGSFEILADVDGVSDKMYIYCAKCMTLKYVSGF